MRTFDDLLREFTYHHQSAGHSPRTVVWYDGQLRRFYGWLEANQVSGAQWLDPRTIERYLAASRQSGNAPATVAGHYRSLNGFFHWLVRAKYLTGNPIDQVEKPKTPRRVPRRTEKDAYAALLNSITTNTWIDWRDRLIINVLFLCGLRRKECAMLTADNFKLKENLLHVREGKGGAERFVPILPAVERAFVAYIFTRPAVDGPLFISADNHNRPLSRGLSGGAIYGMLRRRCRRAGLPVMNPHSFRHGMAMHLLNEGGDMSLVQKVLGHAEISTTAEFYAEWVTAGLTNEFNLRMKGLGQ